MNRYLIYCLLAVLAGCSSAKVLNTEKAEDVSFNSYKSFDFYKVEGGADTLSAFGKQVVQLEDAIALRMQQKGYLLSKTDPDLLINVGVVVREKVQTRQTDFRTDAPRYTGQRRYSWKSQEVETGRYREGTVTIDLVDRKQNKLVWKGVVQDIIPEQESKLDAVIKQGVKKLFADYPSAPKP